MTVSHNFLEGIALPLVKLFEEKEIFVQYHLYLNEDQSELGYVIHLDQKNVRTKECKLNE